MAVAQTSEGVDPAPAIADPNTATLVEESVKAATSVAADTLGVGARGSTVPHPDVMSVDPNTATLALQVVERSEPVVAENAGIVAQAGVLTELDLLRLGDAVAAAVEPSSFIPLGSALIASMLTGGFSLWVMRQTAKTQREEAQTQRQHERGLEGLQHRRERLEEAHQCIWSISTALLGLLITGNGLDANDDVESWDLFSDEWAEKRDDIFPPQGELGRVLMNAGM